MCSAEFDQVWSEIRAAVVDLDKTLGIGNKYQEVVDFIRNDTMDPTRDRHFREQLLEQITEIENLKKDVHSLHSGYRIVCISRRIFCLWIIRLKLSLFPVFQERPKKTMNKLLKLNKR